MNFRTKINENKTLNFRIGQQLFHLLLSLEPGNWKQCILTMQLVALQQDFNKLEKTRNFNMTN